MKRQKAEFWMAHVAAIQREGISTSAYAKRQELSTKSLYGWQRKFKAKSSTTAAARLRPSFVAVQVADSVSSQPHTGCVLQLGCGMRLEMTTLPSPQWLAALGRATQGAQ
jgi:hypothetical protein